MSLYELLRSYNEQRHKVFLSFYHEDDQYYKEMFELRFRHLFINKSVGNGDIDTDLSTEYVKQLIQQGYITDASVLIVLVGPNTCGRKHVDWEISAALSKKAGGYSGLMGILLPNFSLTAFGRYYYKDLPPRLADNVRTGFAKIYTWNSITTNSLQIKNAVHQAFLDKSRLSFKIDNNRIQFKHNK